MPNDHRAVSDRRRKAAAHQRDDAARQGREHPHNRAVARPREHRVHGGLLHADNKLIQAILEHLNHLSYVRVSHGHDYEAPIDADTARMVAECMQVLSTPSRVQILGRLREGACSVGELAEAVGMEASAVSHQLRSLRHLGFVVGERHGKQIVYALHDPHVAELLEQTVFHVQHLRLGFRDPVAMPAETAA